MTEVSQKHLSSTHHYNTRSKSLHVYLKTDHYLIINISITFIITTIIITITIINTISLSSISSSSLPLLSQYHYYHYHKHQIIIIIIIIIAITVIGIIIVIIVWCVFSDIILYKFLVGNNIFYQKQFGFQNAHSTEQAILQQMPLVKENILYWFLLFFFKAFDTVNHNILYLLEKLKAYGIQSENLKLLRSYLSNRKQFISYNDSKIWYSPRFYTRAFAFSCFRKRPQQLD